MPDAPKPPTQAPRSSAIRGTLVAVGGGEDKENDMVILRRCIDEVKGEAKVAVVIGAASREPREAMRPYVRAFDELGIDRVRELRLQTRDAVEDERTIADLEDSDIVYFTGGDQARLADVLRGSPALEMIRKRYQEGAVVGGTSAGAAAMSGVMIARGKPDEALNKGNTQVDEGLGLLPGTVIDTHFIQRGRFGRLLEIVAHQPDLLGLGISEDTAIVLRGGRHLQVAGSDNLIIVDGSQIRRTTTHEAKEGEPMSLDHAIVHALSEGDTFDLAERAFKKIEKPQNKVAA
ncbi:MAG TPA: cyanophycinase [Candidatus Thermoplasmatota archaeon]|nr:cyanophycinase [Candidatus Thermoplasmatota archaeon]